MLNRGLFCFFSVYIVGMRKFNFYMPAFALCFLFFGCKGYSASIEKVQSPYDPSIPEHVLIYQASDGVHSVCLEEEFDLAAGEIEDIQTKKRFFGISFILHTGKDWFYVLNLNEDGSLVLHRMSFRD